MKKIIFLLLICFGSVLAINAQDNLLLNPDAESSIQNWKVTGNAQVEQASGQNNIFVIRNKGSFTQKIKLSEKSADKYILLIGIGSSERVNLDGVITGLPYLYGYLLDVDNPKGGHINTYLTGEKLLGRVKNSSEWVMMYGVFQIPKGTVAAQISLKQAERKYFPQNGSAAKFDNIGLYIFENKNDALNFVRNYE